MLQFGRVPQMDSEFLHFSCTTYSMNIKEICYEKRTPKFHPTLPLPHPYSIPFLSISPQIKVLYNFRKRGQHSIVKRQRGLEYALLLEPVFSFSVQRSLLIESF